jgi:hypothetical protein
LVEPVIGDELTNVPARYTLNDTSFGSVPSQRRLTRLPLSVWTLTTPRSRDST